MANHDEAAIEKEIQAKGKTAARLTPEAIDAKIAGAEYHVFGGVMTVLCAHPAERLHGDRRERVRVAGEF
jgi:hypothetical protein